MECNFENCGYYVDEECTICGMGTDGEDTFCKYCKDNPNCYYKQLTELKAENERLKKEIENNKSAYQCELGTYNMECGNLLEENKELTHYLACMTEQRNKYKAYLQEIKAIAIRAFAKQQEYKKDFGEIIGIIANAESEG